uniref:Uncharacterized protein MANES_05G172500 n=1 Tax=Rhizophora mucronata TaxID=61149 RepID=A0A2P2Q9R1_RHIMU
MLCYFLFRILQMSRGLKICGVMMNKSELEHPRMISLKPVWIIICLPSQLVPAM